MAFQYLRGDYKKAGARSFSWFQSDGMLSVLPGAVGAPSLEVPETADGQPEPGDRQPTAGVGPGGCETPSALSRLMDP